MHTARLWHELQAIVPPDVTVNPAIFATDCTHVTNYSGDGKMRPMYMSTGHIKKAIRNKPSRRAFLVVAFYPECKFAKTVFPTATQQKDMPGRLRMRLFHACTKILLETMQPYQYKSIEMVDPDGNVRLQRIFPAMIITDKPDQNLNAAINQNWCIPCLAETSDLG
ncbi:hypothetical protein AURDEDRAFT_31654, partial [Auricularia subglabra TFB-10046 SS5]